MSSATGARYAAGQVKATNAELKVLTVGFTPKKFRVVNLTNQIQVEWNSGLPVGTNLKRIADGTLSVITSGVEPGSDAAGNKGLKLPVLADINDTTTESLAWEAFG